MKNLILSVKKGSVKNAQMGFQKFTNFKKMQNHAKNANFKDFDLCKKNAKWAHSRKP